MSGVLWAMCLSLLTFTGCGRLLEALDPARARAAAALALSGSAALKARPAPDGDLVVLTERLQGQYFVTRPQRSLVWLTPAGELRRRDAPPAGWLLLDFALHPSGDVTEVLIEDTRLAHTFRVVRLRSGQPAVQETLPTAPRRDAPPEVGTLDVARVMPAEEDTLLMYRTADAAVHAARLPAAGGGPAWDAQVEPGVDLLALGIAGGGFDNFGQGDRAYALMGDVTPAGEVYVAVPGNAQSLAAHAAAFGDGLAAAAPLDAYVCQVTLVTKLDASGRRLWSTLIDARHRRDELHGLRAAGQRVWLFGRADMQPVPDAWDGLLVRLDAATGAIEEARTLDIDGGDVFFDAVPTGDGRLLLAGATSYEENPWGVSISETRAPLAAVLSADGATLTRLPLSAGPRGNEARSVCLLDGSTLLVAGMQNAPGTHSEAITADGFVQRVPF
jgi:hypothetical protein